MVAVLTPHIQNVDKFLEHCHRRRYPAKTTIIYAGDKSDSLYYIIKGSVTVLIEDDDGHEMIVAYLNDGDFFGDQAQGLVGNTGGANVSPIKPMPLPADLAQIIAHHRQ